MSDEHLLLDTIGPYRIEQFLGSGGMANVFLGTRYDEHGWVAIKLMHESMATACLEKYRRGDRDTDQNNPFHMFLDEIIIHQDLDHPNIVRYLDEGHHKYLRAGETIEQPYLVMEYVHGVSFVDVARQAFIAARKSAEPPAGWVRIVARIVEQVCQGLHYVHELRDPEGRLKNALHRDVSPKNVLISHDGAVKVTDFGLAMTDQRIAGSKIGILKGTPAYFSPEQTYSDEKLDRRTDIFSLGVILWELTLFRRLFRRRNELETVLAVREADIPTPTDSCPWYPLALQSIVLRSLAKDPADRFATALEMAEALDEFISATGEPVEQDHVARLVDELFEFEPFPDPPEPPPFFEQDPEYDQSTVRHPSMLEMLHEGRGDSVLVFPRPPSAARLASLRTLREINAHSHDASGGQNPFVDVPLEREEARRNRPLRDTVKEKASAFQDAVDPRERHDTLKEKPTLSQEAQDALANAGIVPVDEILPIAGARVGGPADAENPFDSPGRSSQTKKLKHQDVPASAKVPPARTCDEQSGEISVSVTWDLDELQSRDVQKEGVLGRLIRYLRRSRE